MQNSVLYKETENEGTTEEKQQISTETEVPSYDTGIHTVTDLKNGASMEPYKGIWSGYPIS